MASPVPTLDLTACLASSGSEFCGALHNILTTEHIGNGGCN